MPPLTRSSVLHNTLKRRDTACSVIYRATLLAISNYLMGWFGAGCFFSKADYLKCAAFFFIQ